MQALGWLAQRPAAKLKRQETRARRRAAAQAEDRMRGRLRMKSLPHARRKKQVARALRYAVPAARTTARQMPIQPQPTRQEALNSILAMVRPQRYDRRGWALW